MKLVAIYDGNFDDIDCEIYSIPDNMDVMREKSEYDHWYKNYRPGEMEYKTFGEWLEERGAKDPEESQIKIYDCMS